MHYESSFKATVETKHNTQEVYRELLGITYSMCLVCVGKKRWDVAMTNHSIGTVLKVGREVTTPTPTPLGNLS